MPDAEDWLHALENLTPAVLTGEFVVVTPMFISDGEQNTRSIRPPSIKGALRFWWRALHWGRCLAHTRHFTSALQDLHRREARLFGLATKDDTGGQGLFTLKVQQANHKAERAWKPQSGQQYLLGQGLYHYNDGLLRDYLPPKTRFSVELIFHRDVAEDERNGLEDALVLWGLLGGLGSRARKGLGSVSLQQLSGGRHIAPRNRSEYHALLQRLLHESLGPWDQWPQSLPPFTAFSQHTRIDHFTGTANDPWIVLNEVGESMQMYRSWGLNGQVNGLEAEKNFPTDHHEALRVIDGGRPRHAPQRAIFGLPHNYYFSSKKTVVEVNVAKQASATGERRASPLFIHLHQCPDQSCFAVQTLLAAEFLPQAYGSYSPQLKYKAGKTVVHYPYSATDADWQVVHTYLDRFKTPNWETLFPAQFGGLADGNR